MFKEAARSTYNYHTEHMISQHQENLILIIIKKRGYNLPLISSKFPYHTLPINILVKQFVK